MHLTKRELCVESALRDRPAAKDTIKVTPAMIEAGVSVLGDYDEWVRLGPTGEESLVREILEAALKVSSGDANGN
jgi:hypothetical protein